MCITQSYNIVYIRFMRFWSKRIPQKNHQINIIMFNLCPYLLFSAKMSCKIPVYAKVRYFDEQTSTIKVGYAMEVEE